MSFHEDLEYGERGERGVRRLLERAGIPTRKLEKRSKTKDFDFYLHGWKRCEVKSDRKEQFTGNVAVEYYNCKSGTPSGLSVTKAEIWAFSLERGEGVWVTDTKTLRHYFHTAPYLRDHHAAGDRNADIRLYRRETIFSDIFLRIDDVSPDTIPMYLASLLGGLLCFPCVLPEPDSRSASMPVSSSTAPMSTSQRKARCYSRAA